MLRSAAPGLSYADANRRRLITIEDDVLGVKREIEERWPGQLNVYLDDDREKPIWIITENCDDGVERFVMETEGLDKRVVERLARADGVTGEDLWAVVERENDELEARNAQVFAEQTYEMGERLAHALRKDGMMDHADIFKTNNRKIRQKAMRRTA